MAVRRARASYRRLAILAAAAVACSCGGSATSRGPVTIAEIREGTDARHLILSVRSCLGKPTASLVESRDEVDLLVERPRAQGIRMPVPTASPLFSGSRSMVAS